MNAFTERADLPITLILNRMVLKKQGSHEMATTQPSGPSLDKYTVNV
jgi:hypothetical protein